MIKIKKEDIEKEIGKIDFRAINDIAKHHLRYNEKEGTFEGEEEAINRSDEIYYFKKGIKIYGEINGLETLMNVSRIEYKNLSEKRKIEIVKKIREEKEIRIDFKEFERIGKEIWNKEEKERIESGYKEILRYKGEEIEKHIDELGLSEYEKELFKYRYMQR